MKVNLQAVLKFTRPLLGIVVSMSFTLPAAATEDQTSTQVMACDAQAQKAKSSDPYQMDNGANEQSLGTLSMGAGFLLTIAAVPSEISNSRELERRSRARQALERYRNHILEIRQYQNYLASLEAEAAKVRARIDPANPDQVIPEYHQSGPRRLGSLNASRLVHQAYLEIALRNKPAYFADVVRYAQVRPITDEAALAKYETFARREQALRDRQMARFGRRMAPIGGGVMLLLTGFSVTAHGEKLEQQFRDLKKGDALSANQTKALESVIDCAILNNNTTEAYDANLIRPDKETPDADRLLQTWTR